MSRHLLPAVSLGAALAVFAAVAGGQPPALDAVFKRYDANNDGKLSRAEFEKFAEVAPRLKGDAKAADAVFKQLDAKGNGFVTIDEFKRFAELAGPGMGKGKGFLKKGPFAPKGKEPEAPKAVEKAATAEEVAFFEKKIRPVLIAKCYECHSAETKKGPKGGLALDTRETLREGGDSGPAIVPGNANRSLMVKALKGDGVAQMPPKEKLSADVIADFEKWIAMGAADPRTSGASAKKYEPIDIEKGKKHWAFQLVKKPTPPKANANPIDAFVLAKLDEKQLSPTGPADKRTLLRRVYFDLIGLPPTPEQVEAFVNDTSPNAFEKVVDSLLASPMFGERWGRHWLDVARYAESSGKEQNVVYPHAWRYRDYVIAAFNKDKPYNQFLKEQLAGDLLPAANDDQKAEQLVATGFLAIGPKSHNERNPVQFRLDMADEQIDAMGQGMLGLTVACARCHDHKFDPIPQKDYYAIAGIFTSTETKYGTARVPVAPNAGAIEELPAKANVPAGVTLSKFELDQRKTQLDALKKQRDDAIGEARKDGQVSIRLVVLGVQIGVLERTVANYNSDGTPRKLAMTVGERVIPRDSPVYTRGEPDKPGEVVARGFLQVLTTGQPTKIRSGSGRKELAEWVVSKDNPLTARVFANRVWLHLFGRGIVPTPDNFGTTGQPPSHPELLDYLAASFVENGWSVKKLIRSVVLTQAYQRGSVFDEKNAATDPDNVYLWRMSKRRLDAEAIRDAMYTVAAQLDEKPANGSQVSKFEGPVQGLVRFGLNAAADTNHRSVYMPILRDNVPEVLELFDFAEPSLVTGSRDDTSVPSQALYLMNNPQVMRLADKTAERLLTKYLSDSERIDAGFRLAFGRPPTPTEAKAAEGFLKAFVQKEAKGFRRKDATEKAAWAAFAQALFAAAEFRYVD